jgi:hypothetical protein
MRGAGTRERITAGAQTLMLPKTLVGILGVTLLLSACTQQKPAETKPPQKSAIIAERVEGTSPYKVALSTDPEQPVSQKPARFILTVSDAPGKPAAGLAVKVALVMPIMDMGKNEFVAKEVAPGVYEGSGTFSMDDEWEVFVTLQKGKEKPAKHIFNIRVAE